MYYVYILKSKKDNTLYVGMTEDLKRRVEEHLKAESGFTKGHAPYKLVFYAALPSKEMARHMEEYFKTGSGKAFISRHVISKQ